jgi:hypothetical protein
MKLVQVVPRHDATESLKTQLKAKERALRGKGTTWKRKKAGRWVHTKYPGWVTWGAGPGGLLVAEVKSKKSDAEWQLSAAFVGYLERHFAETIESITITFR